MLNNNIEEMIDNLRNYSKRCENDIKFNTQQNIENEYEAYRNGLKDGRYGDGYWDGYFDGRRAGIQVATKRI